MPKRAGVAELVDALDLGSSDASRGGSSPSARTNVRPAEIHSNVIPKSGTRFSETITFNETITFM